jgi:ADP-ribosyl-[dinitrogen reductase] hydrolase
MTDLSNYNKAPVSLVETKVASMANKSSRPLKIADEEAGTMIQRPNLPALLEHVIAAAEAAGRALAEEFVRSDGPRGAAGHADVDDEIEAPLRKQLLELLPARWRGEETGVLKGAGGPFCWLVDSHDGTSGFLAGDRGSAVSIALLHNGVPVLGVVHAPLSPDRGKDTIAWAQGLDHLLRNGIPIAPALADAALSAGAIVFVSQAAPEYPVGNARAVAPGRFVALPSIAYRLARTAAGDGVAATSLNGPCGWDYAAGHALIRGAGGILVNEHGHEVTYTVDGSSYTGFCFGGAPRVVQDLATRDWHRVREGVPAKPRTVIGWPRLASEVARARRRMLAGSDRRRFPRIASGIPNAGRHRTPISKGGEETRRWRDMENNRRSTD